ncbi:disease resistance protein RPM1-like [Argentina anserina]|uniref:disease resistance protein RPM1-like n=1 Tax=Argentina anserina TaxID=57926 RepID=UPI0021766A69|nr:disease resistance protein RPM1-like [Potentilla anserina]
MSESAVSFLLNKISPFLTNGVQLLGGVREELIYLNAELERMRALLKNADAIEEGDEELKVWIKQIREVAHDAEDVIDEFTLLQTCHNHGHSLYYALELVSYSVKNLKAHYRVAKELQIINTRIKEIFAVHKTLRPKLIAANDSIFASSGCTWHDRRDDALLLDDADVVGIDEPKHLLVSWLVKGDCEREVISVTGMGGMGKTTLVKKVYDDVEVKKHFKPRAWITVSQSFEAQDLLKDIIRKLHSEIGRGVPEGVDGMHTNKLKAIIKSLLQKRRYLIVLDDVWHTNVWDTVKYAFPNGKLGSRVMITTRKSDVASTSCSESGGHVYEVRPLPAEEAWELFNRKAFQRKSCPLYLESFCNDILKKCEGLPLAIVAVSGVLATKDQRRIDEWDNICRSLGAEIHGNDKLEDLKKVLSLSFNDLPYNLKACYLCLSIFPEGHLIKHMKIIRLWIAERFVEAREGRTLEEVAEDYLKELLNRNLMLVGGTTSDGRVKTYRIHDLLREIIVSKSKDQNFASIVKEHNTIWPDRVRRLSLHNVLQTVRQSRSFPQLRSLFIFGAVSRSSMCKNLSNGFRLLRMLDIEAAPIQTFPREIMDLFYLSYLSLRKTQVKVIPRSIGNLRNLETLDLKHTCVTELPVEILKLQKLRHLLVYHLKITSYAHFNSKFGFKVLSSIGDLQALQKLCFIEANQGGEMTIRDLAKLKQLRRLGIIKLRQEDGFALCLSLESLTKLRSFSVNSVGENEIIDLQHLSSPPQFLERLYLTGRLEELPSWIPSLHSLVKLFLKWSRLKDDPMVLLQNLPNLVHLELLQTCDCVLLSFKGGGFKKLKVLGLDKFDKLRCVKVEKGAMPCLERLTIQRCELLKRVPSGVQNLTKLKSLQFFNMPYELISKLRPDGEGEDYGKVAHIPEVYSAYWRDGGWDVYPIESFKEIENSPSAASTVRRSHELRPLRKV